MNLLKKFQVHADAYIEQQIGEQGGICIVYGNCENLVRFLFEVVLLSPVTIGHSDQ